MNATMRMLLAALAALLVLAGCGADDAVDDITIDDPVDEPDITESPTPDPDDDPITEEPERDRDVSEATMDITGTFTGDESLEGGCAWVEVRDGERYEVIWPEGYTVEWGPLRLIGPDGDEVAGDGDEVTLQGDIARDMASFCMVGTMFEATAVE